MDRSVALGRYDWAVFIWLRPTAAALAVVVVGLTSACGGSPEEPTSNPRVSTTRLASRETSTSTSTESQPRWETEASGPAKIRIPRISVDAEVIDLDLNADGSLQTPDDDFSQAGWYTGRAAPGEQGPAVVVGHVDNKTGPAVFYRLRELVAGDEVEITRDDGSSVVYIVTYSEQVGKDAFPTEKVYGGTLVPELRLVTCGGEFDRRSGHYVDNIVTYAKIRGA